MNNKLIFRIHRVKCIDETGGKWAEKLGNDEIYLGGGAIKTNQTLEKIAVRSIYPHFDDGDVKVFNPPMELYTFDIPQKPENNLSAGVFLVLIERDKGNMESDVSKILEKSRSSLISYFREIIPPRPLPQIPDLIGFLPSLANEVFYPQLAALVIPKAGLPWSDTSAQKTVKFSGHQGLYELTYDWKLL